MFLTLKQCPMCIEYALYFFFRFLNDTHFYKKFFKKHTLLNYQLTNFISFHFTQLANFYVHFRTLPHFIFIYDIFLVYTTNKHTQTKYEPCLYTDLFMHSYIDRQGMCWKRLVTPRKMVVCSIYVLQQRDFMCQMSNNKNVKEKKNQNSQTVNFATNLSMRILWICSDAVVSLCANIHFLYVDEKKI